MEKKSPLRSEPHHKSLAKKRSPTSFKGIVPKLIVTSNEKYLRRCLELVLLNASKEALIPDSGSNPYPSGLFLNYPGHWIIGTISGSKTMSNILTSPLYKSLNPSSHFENSVFSNSIISCSNSSSSSPSSSSSFAYPFSRAILRCTSTHGIPHYTLSVDGKRETHTASFSRIENNSPDFVYLFRSNTDLVGPKIAAKMSVLTSLCFSPDGAKVKETEFTLSEVSVDLPDPEKATQKRSKGLTEKVVGVLKGGHNFRRRTFSKFDIGFSIREPGPDPGPCLDQFGETLAVVVREDDFRQEVGGWGMKFLRRNGGVRRCPCSTSVDIIVPAGFHGGPRPGGPSGLVERWRAGGSCDCGGWDVGCPLDVFETCSVLEEGRDKFEKVEVFKVGRVRNLPTLRMEKIYEDMYSIQYGPGLSALQSFSVALAMLHTRNPGLIPAG